MTHARESFDPRKYWEDRLEAKFDLTGVGFRRKSVAFNKWAYKIREDALDELIRDGLIKPGEKDVLDVGCGTGFFIRYWLEQKPRSVSGIDITDVSIKQLKDAIPEAEFTMCG